MSAKVFLETDRLLVRELVKEDAEGMYALDSNPQVHRYLGGKTVKSIEESKETIALVRQQYKAFGIGRWAVINKANNDFIGWTGLKYEQKQINGTSNYYDLGYRLRPQYWGQGIATETGLMALQYGFTILNLETINAAADANNSASNAVLKKLGLKQIEMFDYNGITCSWYAIHQEDWRF